MDINTSKLQKILLVICFVLVVVVFSLLYILKLRNDDLKASKVEIEKWKNKYDTELPKEKDEAYKRGYNKGTADGYNDGFVDGNQNYINDLIWNNYVDGYDDAKEEYANK